MVKLDLKKEFKSYYKAGKEPELIDLPKVQYISIEGKGDPSGGAFAANIQLLYPVVYAIKFACKANKNDFVVPPLEGLWWFDESVFGEVRMENAPNEIPREAWQYRLMIRMPEFVSELDFKKAVDVVKSKKGIKGLEKLEWFELHEGKCLQMMHTGPFETEPESLEKLIRYCLENDLKKNGHHHEIYLSDFRKTAPEKLRTILREPVI